MIVRELSKTKFVSQRLVLGTGPAKMAEAPALCFRLLFLPAKMANVPAFCFRLFFLPTKMANVPALCSRFLCCRGCACFWWLSQSLFDGGGNGSGAGVQVAVLKNNNNKRNEQNTGKVVFGSLFYLRELCIMCGSLYKVWELCIMCGR